MKVLSERERGVIFRLGRLVRVCGPGFVLTLPLIDQLVVLDLDRVLRQWRDVAPGELEAMVGYLVTHYPEVPANLSLQEIREAMYLADEPFRPAKG